MRDPVLVVGGGLAGVACARELGSDGVDVTLVDRNDYHQFQPLLYQVASSQLPAEDIARPHRTIFHDLANVEVVTAAVSAVDLTAHTLELEDGRVLQGSAVVLAAGARPNFFGIPGAAEHAFPLYSVADAERLRLHLQRLLQAAASDRSPAEGMVDVVVVGGGPTGVETTGALAELMNALHETGRLGVAGRVTLVDRGPALLGQFSAEAHEYAYEKLTTAGADVRLGVGVTDRPPGPRGARRRHDHRHPHRGLGRWRVGRRPRGGRGLRDGPWWPHRRAARPHGAWPPGRLRGGRRGQHPVRRRPARRHPAPARVRGAAVGEVGGEEHPARTRGRGPRAVRLQGQGHHGDDRPQRGGRRGRQAAPRGGGPDRVRRLAGGPRGAAERGAQQDRRLPRVGLGLLRA